MCEERWCGECGQFVGHGDGEKCRACAGEACPLCGKQMMALAGADGWTGWECPPCSYQLWRRGIVKVSGRLLHQADAEPATEPVLSSPLCDRLRKEARELLRHAVHGNRYVVGQPLLAELAALLGESADAIGFAKSTLGHAGDIIDRSEQNRQQLADACNRLWPYIQHFGLCGADPAATLAVQDIGVILGKAEETAREAYQAVQADTARRITHWLCNHRYVGRHIRRSAFEKLLSELNEYCDKGCPGPPVAVA